MLPKCYAKYGGVDALIICFLGGSTGYVVVPRAMWWFIQLYSVYMKVCKLCCQNFSSRFGFLFRFKQVVDGKQDAVDKLAELQNEYDSLKQLYNDESRQWQLERHRLSSKCHEVCVSHNAFFSNMSINLREYIQILRVARGNIESEGRVSHKRKGNFFG